MRSAETKAIVPSKLNPSWNMVGGQRDIADRADETDQGQEGADDHVLEICPESVPLKEHHPVDLGGNGHSQDAGYEVPDDQLAVQHHQIGDRVAGGGRPAVPRFQPLPQTDRCFVAAFLFRGFDLMPRLTCTSWVRAPITMSSRRPQSCRPDHAIHDVKWRALFSSPQASEPSNSHSFTCRARDKIEDKLSGFRYQK